MARAISRRDMLRFIGGATVGIPLTPLLWKSTDDLSIWTQNWERIPRLPRGPETVRFTHCTLCPAGCPVRVRCIAGRPVSLTGVPATPASYGALCPFAYASHQMPFDPRRVTTPLLRSRRGDAAPLGPASLDAAVALVAGAMIGAAAAGERVAIIDSRPHSTLSHLYARFLAAVPGGVRLSTASTDDDPLATLASMLDGPCGPLGFDLQNSRTILSFGAPLLEGWGTPVQGAGLRSRQACGRPDPRIVQVETRPSHTARLADRWLPIRPGTETAVALGLAHVIVGRRLHDVDAVRRGALDFERADRRDFLRLVERFSPERVAALTGLSRESLIATAIEFATRKPAVALWGGDPGSGPLPREAAIAIAALNLIVGGVGRRGGIVPAAMPPAPAAWAPAAPAAADSLAGIADGSVRVLILDDGADGEPIPWPAIETKLSGPDALVVRLSPFLGDRRGRADIVLPVPAWLEEYRDVCATAAGPSFGIAVPFIDPPSGIIDRAALLHRIATAAGMPFDAPSTAVDVVRSRVAAVHAGGRGELLRFADGERIAVAGIGSAEALWQGMMSGAGWFDRSAPRLTLPSFRLLGPCEDGFERLLAEAEASGRRAAAGGNVPLWLMPFGLPGTVGEGPVPALACKLYRESDLRLQPGCIAVSPATARALSLREGRRVVLQIPAGRLQVEVRLDPLVLPGVAHIPVGPAPERPAGAEEAGRLIASLRAPGGPVARRMIPAHVVEA